MRESCKRLLRKGEQLKDHVKRRMKRWIEEKSAFNAGERNWIHQSRKIALQRFFCFYVSVLENISRHRRVISFEQPVIRSVRFR